MRNQAAPFIHSVLLLSLGGIHLGAVNLAADASGGVFAGLVGDVRIVDLLTLLGFAVPGSTAALASSFLVDLDQPGAIVFIGNLVFAVLLSLFVALGWVVCKRIGGRQIAGFFASLFVLAACNIVLASLGWRAAAIETIAGWGAPSGVGFMASTLLYMVSGVILNVSFYSIWYVWAHQKTSGASPERL